MAIYLRLENVDRVPGLQGHDCFFPVWTTSDYLTYAAILAAMVRGPDAGDRHVEELLDRLLDLSLRRFRMHAECVFTTILIRRRGLLGDDRSDDGASQCWHCLLSSSPFSSCRRTSSPLISWRSWPRPSAWPTCPPPSNPFSPPCGRWRSSPLLSRSSARPSPCRGTWSPTSDEPRAASPRRRRARNRARWTRSGRHRTTEGDTSTHRRTASRVSAAGCGR